MIEITYLIIALISLIVGFSIGWIVGKKIHELNRMKRVLRAKNPELWDLEHYVVVDEDTKKYQKRVKGSNPSRS